MSNIDKTRAATDIHKSVSKEMTGAEQEWKRKPESERTRICVDKMAANFKKEAEQNGGEMSADAARAKAVQVAEHRDKRFR